MIIYNIFAHTSLYVMVLQVVKICVKNTRIQPEPDSFFQFWMLFNISNGSGLGYFSTLQAYWRLSAIMN